MICTHLQARTHTHEERTLTCHGSKLDLGVLTAESLWMYRISVPIQRWASVVKMMEKHSASDSGYPARPAMPMLMHCLH